jgi:hypothetical protein
MSLCAFYHSLFYWPCIFIQLVCKFIHGLTFHNWAKFKLNTIFCYRSEDMTLYQLTVPKDDSWDIMNQLGTLDVAHFINLNKGEQPFNLPYAN